MTRLRRATALLALVPLSAFATPRTLAVGVGDCGNGELLTGLASFQTALEKRLGKSAIDGEQALAIVRPRAERSLEDIQRQVETARTLFYSGQSDRALDQLKQALTDLDRVSPHLEAWKTTRDALLVQALAYRSLNRQADAKDAFTRVLRVEPTATLDPTLYTPTIISTFEGLKRTLARSRHARLQVTSTPPGATVMLDGRDVGKTPLSLPLLPARYRVSLVSGPRASFSRTVTLPGESQVKVDLAFEGAVSLQAPACIEKGGAPEALKLAALVGADQVVVFLLDSARGDPSYFRGTLYSVPQGTRIREGGVTKKGAGSFDELVTFVVTGEKAPGVLTAEALQAPKPADVPKVEPVEPGPAPKAEVPAVLAHAPSSRPTVLGWSLVGGGAAVAALGVVVWVGGGAERAQLAARTASDGKLVPPSEPGHREALDLMPKVDFNRAFTFGFVGAGVGAALAGAGVLFFAPGSPVQATAALSPDGASVHVSGRW